MKVRSALVTVEFPGSEAEKTPPAGRRRGAKLATAIAYPYVAEPPREPASPSSWPFAPTTPPASPKPEKVVEVRAPEPNRELTGPSPARALGAVTELRAVARLPKKVLPIPVPPPAGHTEPPPAPQFTAPDASDPSLASTVHASDTALTAEVAAPPQPESPSLLESVPAAAEATDPSVDPLPPAVDVPPPADSQPAALALAADGGSEPEPEPEPSSDERPSRARIVERLWEDPLREELVVNLGATTESNLYVDMDQRIANGGVFVATYQDLPPGTHVSLHITLAGGLATSAHGRVTLKRESLEAFGDPAPGVCVAFELLSTDTLALLEQFAAIRTPWLIEDE